ncbi:MAG: hypothetical protein QF460_01205 [Candidatus Nanoarchaeia archaeon]|jgi:hypothetical protein|nr:hypothetical protein [Candidatus Nanoarchaeia archaeon]|tara:strand:- start:2541 stop:2924 length:384 start_codon:yes stop_codon:yes gene_type:complete
MKLKKKTIKTSAIALLILVALGFAMNTMMFKADPAKLELAQCLTEKNVKMYGAFWCGACETQKELFGPAFKAIDYVECDERGQDAQPEVCQLEGISGYPTWKINGQKSTGVQPLESLATATGCEYQG